MTAGSAIEESSLPEHLAVPNFYTHKLIA